MNKLKIWFFKTGAKMLYYFFGKYRHFVTFHNNESLSYFVKNSKFKMIKRKDNLTVFIFTINGHDFLHIDTDSFLHFEDLLSQIMQSYWLGYLAGKEDKKYE